MGAIRGCKTTRFARYTPPCRLSRDGTERGRSSGVEHNLAKVGVVSSNLIARSNFSHQICAPPLLGVFEVCLACRQALNLVKAHNDGRRSGQLVLATQCLPYRLLR